MKSKKYQELEERVISSERRLDGYDILFKENLRQIRDKKQKKIKFWKNYSGAMQGIFLFLAGINLFVLSDILLATFCIGIAIYTNIDYWNHKRELKE